MLLSRIGGPEILYVWDFVFKSDKHRPREKLYRLHFWAFADP